MIRIKLTAVFAFCLISFITVISCSDNNPTGPGANVVDNPLPLSLGNRWNYVNSQSISIDTTKDEVDDLSSSSTGIQAITISRTEAFPEGEAFGLEYTHILQYLADPTKADTTVEVYYLVPLGDRILYKAIESVYNTGGFIPFGSSSPKKQAVYTRISVGGNEVEISLEELGRLLLEPLPAYIPGVKLDALLASDGIQNNNNVYYYESEYVFVYDNLRKGFEWTSAEALGVGGVEITQKVSDILPELDGFEGPIAEVTFSNTFIDYYNSDKLDIRYYYKSGVGIIRAEIHDPAMRVELLIPDGHKVVDECGEWFISKRLVSYSVNQ